MKLLNYTRHRIPRKWLQKMLDHLGVNPLIEIHYADNPNEVEKPNYRHVIGKSTTDVDGIADDENRVFLYIGTWKTGEFQDFTIRYVKWILLHELRHQFYYYHIGNTRDPWKGLRQEERSKREERACNRFANLIMGIPDKTFPRIRNNVKTKSRITKKTKVRR